MEQFYYVLKYLILGLFQGLTEPIPISSSGHLVLAQHLLGLKIEGFSFELLVNSASLLAVLLIYRNDLIRLTRMVSLIYLQEQKTQNQISSLLFILLLQPFQQVLLVFYLKITSIEYLKGVKMVGVSFLLLLSAFGLLEIYAVVKMMATFL